MTPMKRNGDSLGSVRRRDGDRFVAIVWPDEGEVATSTSVQFKEYLYMVMAATMNDVVAEIMVLCSLIRLLITVFNKLSPYFIILVYITNINSRILLYTACRIASVLYRGRSSGSVALGGFVFVA